MRIMRRLFGETMSSKASLLSSLAIQTAVVKPASGGCSLLTVASIQSCAS